MIDKNWNPDLFEFKKPTREEIIKDLQKWEDRGDISVNFSRNPAEYGTWATENFSEFDGKPTKMNGRYHPKSGDVFVNTQLFNDSRSARITALHELGHAIDYKYNFKEKGWIDHNENKELSTLRKEYVAWHYARVIDPSITPDHFEKYLDVYRKGNNFPYDKERYDKFHKEIVEKKIALGHKDFVYDYEKMKNQKPINVKVADILSEDFKLENYLHQKGNFKSYTGIKSNKAKKDPEELRQERFTKLNGLLKDVDTGLLKDRDRKKTSQHPNKHYQRQVAWDLDENKFYIKDYNMSKRFVDDQRKRFREMLGVDYSRNTKHKDSYVMIDGKKTKLKTDDFLLKATAMDSMFDYLSARDLVGEKAYQEGIELYGDEFERKIETLRANKGYRSAWLATQLYQSGTINEGEMVFDLHKKARLQGVMYGEKPDALHIVENSLNNRVKNASANEQLRLSTLESLYAQEKQKMFKEDERLLTHQIAPAPFIQPKKEIRYWADNVTGKNKWIESMRSNMGLSSTVAHDEARNLDKRRYEVLNYITNGDETSYAYNMGGFQEFRDGKPNADTPQFKTDDARTLDYRASYMNAGKLSVPYNSDLIMNLGGFETYQSASHIIKANEALDRRDDEEYMKRLKAIKNMPEGLQPEALRKLKEEYKSKNFIQDLEERGYRLTYNMEGEQVYAQINKGSTYYTPAIEQAYKMGADGRVVPERMFKNFDKNEDKSQYVLSDIGRERFEHISRLRGKMYEESNTLKMVRRHIWEQGKDNDFKHVMALDEDVRKYLGFKAEEEVNFEKFLDKAFIYNQYVGGQNLNTNDDLRLEAGKAIASRAEEKGIYVDERDKKKAVLDRLNKLINETDVGFVLETKSGETAPSRYVTYAKDLETEYKLLRNQQRDINTERQMLGDDYDFKNQNELKNMREAMQALREQSMITTGASAQHGDDWLTYHIQKAMLNADINDKDVLSVVSVEDTEGNKRLMTLPSTDVFDEMLKNMTPEERKALREQLPEARPMDLARGVFNAALHQRDIALGELDDKGSLTNQRSMNGLLVKTIGEDGEEKDYKIMHYDPRYKVDALTASADSRTALQKKYVDSYNVLNDVMREGSFYQKPGDRVPVRILGFDDQNGLAIAEKKHILTDEIAKLTIDESGLDELLKRTNPIHDTWSNHVYNDMETYFNDREADLRNQLLGKGDIEILLTPEISEDKYNGKKSIRRDANEAISEVWSMMGKEKGWKTFGSGSESVRIPAPILDTLYRRAPSVVHQMENNPSSMLSYSYVSFANAMLKSGNGQTGLIDLNYAYERSLEEANEKGIKSIAPDDFSNLMMKSIDGSFLAEALSLDNQLEKRTGAMRFRHIVKANADAIRQSYQQRGERIPTYTELAPTVHEMLNRSNAGVALGEKYTHMKGLENLTQAQIEEIMRDIEFGNKQELSYDRMIEVKQNILDYEDDYTDKTSEDMRRDAEGNLDTEGLDEDEIRAIRNRNELTEQLGGMANQDRELAEMLSSGKHGTEGTDTLGGSAYQGKLNKASSYALINSLLENEAIDETLHQSLKEELEKNPRATVLTGSHLNKANIDYDATYFAFNEFINKFGHDEFYRSVDVAFARGMLEKSSEARGEFTTKHRVNYAELENLAKLKELYPDLKITGETSSGRMFDVVLGNEGQIEGLFHDTGRHELIADRKAHAKTTMGVMGANLGRVVPDEKPKVNRNVTFGQEVPIPLIPDVNYNNLTRVGPKSYLEHSPAESFLGMANIMSGEKGIVTDFETLMLPDDVKDPSKQAWIMESTLEHVTGGSDGLVSQGIEHQIIRPNQDNVDYINALLGKDTLALDSVKAKDAYGFLGNQGGSQDEYMNQLSGLFREEKDLATLRNLAKYAGTDTASLWADYSNEQLATAFRNGRVDRNTMVSTLRSDAMKALNLFQTGTEEQWRNQLGIKDTDTLHIMNQKQWMNNVVPTLQKSNVIGQNIIGAEYRMMNQQIQGIRDIEQREASNLYNQFTQRFTDFLNDEDIPERDQLLINTGDSYQIADKELRNLYDQMEDLEVMNSNPYGKAYRGVMDDLLDSYNRDSTTIGLGEALIGPNMSKDTIEQLDREAMYKKKQFLDRLQSDVAFNDSELRKPKEFNAIEMMHFSKQLYPELQEKGLGFSMGSLVNHVLQDEEGRKLYESGAHTSYIDTQVETKVMNQMLSDMGNTPDVGFLKKGDYVMRSAVTGDVGERGVYQVMDYTSASDGSNPRLALQSMDGEALDVTDTNLESLRRKFSRNFIPLSQTDFGTPQDAMDYLAWDDAREDVLTAQTKYHSMKAHLDQNRLIKEKLGDKEFTAENIMALSEDGYIKNTYYEDAYNKFNSLYSQMTDFDKRIEEASQGKINYIADNGLDKSVKDLTEERRKRSEMVNNIKKEKEAFFDGLSIHERNILSNKQYFSEEKMRDNLYMKLTPRKARALEKSNAYFSSSQARVQEMALSQAEDLKSAGLANDSEARALIQEMNDAIKQKAQEKGRYRTQNFKNMMSFTLDERFKDLSGREMTIRTNNVQQISQGLESTLQRMIQSEVGLDVRNALSNEGTEITEDAVKSRIMNQYLLPFLNEQETFTGPIEMKSDLEDASLKVDHLSQKLYSMGQQQADVYDPLAPFTNSGEDYFAREINDIRAGFVNEFIDKKAGRSTLPTMHGNAIPENSSVIHSAGQFVAFERLRQQRSLMKKEGFSPLPGMKMHSVNQGDTEILGMTDLDRAVAMFGSDKFAGATSKEITSVRNYLQEFFRNDKDNPIKDINDTQARLNEMLQGERSNFVTEHITSMVDGLKQRGAERSEIRKELARDLSDTWRETYDRLMRLSPTNQVDPEYVNNISDLVEYHKATRNDEALQYLRDLNWMDADENLTNPDVRIFPKGLHAGKPIYQAPPGPDARNYYGNQPILMSAIEDYNNMNKREVTVEPPVSVNDTENPYTDRPSLDDGGDYTPYNPPEPPNDGAGREAINRGLENVREAMSNKWVKFAGLGAVGALMTYGMTRQPDVLERPQSGNENYNSARVPLESKENDAIRMTQQVPNQAPQIPQGQGVKPHPTGYDVKIGGQANGTISHGRLSQDLQGALNDKLSRQAQINLNTSDNSANINRQWLEDRFSDLMKDGYVGGI